jgi:hypothetical protein
LTRLQEMYPQMSSKSKGTNTPWQNWQGGQQQQQQQQGGGTYNISLQGQLTPNGTLLIQAPVGLNFQGLQLQAQGGGTSQIYHLNRQFQQVLSGGITGGQQSYVQGGQGAGQYQMPPQLVTQLSKVMGQAAQQAVIQVFSSGGTGSYRQTRAKRNR